MEQMTILYAQKLLEDLMDFSSSSDEDDEILAVLSQINESPSNGNLTNQKETNSKEKPNNLNKIKVNLNNENTMQHSKKLNNVHVFERVTLPPTFPIQLHLSKETIDEFEQELSEQQHTIDQHSLNIVSPTIDNILENDTNITSPKFVTSPTVLLNETTDDRPEIPTSELIPQPEIETTQPLSKNLNSNKEIVEILTENELSVRENEFVYQILYEYSEKVVRM